MAAKIFITLDQTGDVVSAVANGDAELYLNRTDERDPTPEKVKTEVVTSEQFERLVAHPNQVFPKGRWT